MTKSTTITINGRLYDAVTGMPLPHMSGQNVAPIKPVRAFSDVGPSKQVSPVAVSQPAKAAPASRAAAHPDAQAMHRRTQKSETLYRKALKKPTPQHTHHDPHRSPLIRHFQQAVVQPIAAEAPAAEETPQATHMHPLVAKVLQHRAEATRPEPTSKELKEQLIKARLSEVGEPKEKKRSFWARQPRMATILASTLSLLILGGYLTFINLPNISMKVASTRAGINAAFPGYKPDGYNLNGPITYSPGQVTVTYKSNTNDNAFKLTQKASNWDSQAVLDNYVTKQTGNYLTFQDHGLTIYTFDNKAAWANGGMLYTVDGTASLSSDQILRLATSL